MVLTQLNSSNRLSLVFIDPTVDNYIQLVAGVTPETEVVLLDRHRDGIAQIGEALSDRDVSSLHIVSHGRPGEVRLGTARLNVESIAQFQAALSQWRSSLRPNGEVLLYGCSVAAGAAGLEFLQALQAELGCAIAASSTPIGSAAKGGNWHLDVQLGTVDAAIAFSPAVTQTYASVFVEDNEADVLLEEDFSDASGTTPPPGWEDLTLAGNPATDQWRFDNPGNRTSIARALDGTFAIYDSDALSDDNVSESVVLESPVFNATDAPNVYLQFDQFYGGIASGINASTVYVEASSNGTSWTPVYTSNFDGNLVNTPTVDLTQQLAGQANAQVRFRFDGNWAFAWAVDNVRVVDFLAPGVNLPSEQVAVSETNVPDPLRFQFSLDSRPTSDVTLNFVVDGQQ